MMQKHKPGLVNIPPKETQNFDEEMDEQEESQKEEFKGLPYQQPQDQEQ